MILMNEKLIIILIVTVFQIFREVNGGLNDYINDIRQYFGYSQIKHKQEDFTHNVPYEVSTLDEKFISEAAKLTGVALSDLDSCQQRVILKLKTDCHKLNDEQLAKLAVHLLNCQSYIEGRKIYPCNENMSIKECTTTMDSDTWTIYHLMSNRARAVCYMVRQTQFRGLAENTVNRLMSAAKEQMSTLDRISANQENLQNIAHETYDTLSKGHDVLSQQQKDIQHAQFQGQLVIEDNIGRLVNEKRIIAETHNKLLKLSEDLQEKLDDSSVQLRTQNDESKSNHQELIRDLISIQEQTKEIFTKIEESSQLLIRQSREFEQQYHSTLKNLKDVNDTVHGLVTLVGGTRKALEERLEWVSNSLGGTYLALERLYIIVWHLVFLLFGMLGCAFLSAQTETRVLIVLVPSLNLAIAFYEKQQYLNPISLVAATMSLVLVQKTITWITNYKQTKKEKVPMLKGKSPTKENVSLTPNDIKSNEFPQPDSREGYYSTPRSMFDRTLSEDYDEFGTPTPPLSRSGFYRSRSRSNTPNVLGGKSSCHAKTRAGTPCKLSSLAGRDFCYRHLKGDSIVNG